MGRKGRGRHAVGEEAELSWERFAEGWPKHAAATAESADARGSCSACAAAAREVPPRGVR